MGLDPGEDRPHGGVATLHRTDAVVDVVGVARPVDVARFHHQPEVAAGCEHVERRGGHLGERGILEQVGGRVADRNRIFFLQPVGAIGCHRLDDDRLEASVGGREGQVPLLRAEETEEPGAVRHAGPRRLCEHVGAAPARRAQGEPVAAAAGGVDLPECRFGDVFVARLEVAPLPLVVLHVGAEPAPDEHIEAGQGLGTVRHREPPELIAGDVLVVVAADVRGVGAGGCGVRDRHARHGADGPALLLERESDRLERTPFGIDVDRVVVGLGPRAQRRGRGGRIGHRVRPLAAAAREIAQVDQCVPRRRATEPWIVAAARLAAGIPHRLGIDVKRGAVVRRARDTEPEVGRGGGIVLERKSRAAAGVVGHPAGGGDRGGSGGRPVEAVEHDEDDPLFAGTGRLELQPVDVGLVEVGGVGVECALGQSAVECLESRCVTVDAV